MDFFKNIFYYKSMSWCCCITISTVALERNYSIQNYPTECPRSTIIKRLKLLPSVIVDLIRQYEAIIHQHSIPVTSTIEHSIDQESPATAFALLPRDRIVIANKKGMIFIVNYLNGKILHRWKSLQREIDQIDTVSYGIDAEIERITSRTPPIIGNIKIWDGMGKQLHSTINRYACNAFQPMLSTFDAATIATSNALSSINEFIAVRAGSPFNIRRVDCKHIIYLTPATIIAGFRSGALEHWHYKFSPPTAMWSLKRLKTSTPNLPPITALCTVSEQSFLAGFTDGIIEMWHTGHGLQKTWQAHKTSIKNIKMFNKDVCISTADKTLKVWQLPSYEQIGKFRFHTPIISVLTTNQPHPPNYVIVCFAEEPLQIWSC